MSRSRQVRRSFPFRMHAVLALFLVSSCGSSGMPSGINEPDVALAQVEMGETLLAMSGRVSIPYVIQIRNTSDIPIQLERVQLRSMGEGAYVINETITDLPQEQIAPGQVAQLGFHAWAVSNGGTMNSATPTTIRAVAHFASTAGAFRKVFTETLGGIAGTMP